MRDDYIDQYGGNRQDKSYEDSKLVKAPLVMGIICFVIYAVYLWTAFHSRSAVMALVIFVPLLSIIGLVISFITRNARYYTNVWIKGLICCLLSLGLFFLIYVASWFALAQR